MKGALLLHGLLLLGSSLLKLVFNTLPVLSPAELEVSSFKQAVIK